MEFAHKADADNVVLFHHDPYHTDGELEELLDRGPRRSGRGWRTGSTLAHEGMTIMLEGGDPVRLEQA